MLDILVSMVDWIGSDGDDIYWSIYPMTGSGMWFVLRVVIYLAVVIGRHSNGCVVAMTKRTCSIDGGRCGYTYGRNGIFVVNGVL